MKGMPQLKNDPVNRWVDQVKFQNYVIKATDSTPFVAMETMNRTLLLKGTSCPENPEEFYNKVNSLLDFFISKGHKSLHVTFSLEYFNTGSARCIYQLLARVREFKASGKDVLVCWYYNINDDDMLLSGKNFSSYTQLDMKLIPISPALY